MSVMLLAEASIFPLYVPANTRTVAVRAGEIDAILNLSGRIVVDGHARGIAVDAGGRRCRR